MVSRLLQTLPQNLGGRSQRIVKAFVISASLVSALASQASPSDTIIVHTRDLSGDKKLPSDPLSSEWIEDFQYETQLSDASVQLLINIFGKDELYNPDSPLRLKFSIIYQTLLSYNIDFITIAKTLDAMIAAFAKEHDTAKYGEVHREMLIASLDIFVPEFMINFYENGQELADVQAEVEIEVAKRSEARKLIELVREDWEKALALGKISVEQQDALEQYYRRDTYLDKFEPLPWQKGDWQNRNDRLKAQYFISDKETPYNALVAELLHRVCEKLHPLPTGKDEWIPTLRDMANTYRTTSDLIAYAKSVLHDDGDSEKLSVAISNISIDTEKANSELPTWSNTNIFDVLGSLDKVARKMSEEQKKTPPRVEFTAADNMQLINTHFADRPVVKLYLQYQSAIFDFPNKKIVDFFREKKNLVADTIAFTDQKVIASYDLVPMSGVRENMKIRGQYKSDIAYSDTIKYFRYKTFQEIIPETYISVDKGSTIKKEKTHLVTKFLIDIFDVFQKKWSKEEARELKMAEKTGVIPVRVPRDSKTVSVMMCYAIVHGEIPDREQTLELLKQIQEVPHELQALRDAKQDLALHQFYEGQQTTVSALEQEKMKMLEEVADRAIYALRHPQGTKATDNVQSDKYRGLKACGQNGRMTMKNLIAKTYPDKEQQEVYTLDEFQAALDQDIVPVWKNGEAYGLYKLLPKLEMAAIVEAPTRAELFDKITQELNRLAIVNNNNIFEIYFWTGYYPLSERSRFNPKTQKEEAVPKGHRTPVFLNSTGEWMVLDPIQYPGGHSRKPFPLSQFFERVGKPGYIEAHSTKGKSHYKCVIDVSYRYGYLGDETVSALAVAAANPDVMHIMQEKLGSTESDKYLSSLANFKSFAPPEIKEFIIEDLTVDLVAELYPDIDISSVLTHAAIVQAINSIKNVFDRRIVTDYVRNGDIVELQQFLFGDIFDEDGNISDEIAIDMSLYSGVLDEKTLRAIQSLNDESYYKDFRAVSADMGYGSSR